MSRDALHIEYRQLKNQLRGISPKLELYKRLEKQLLELEQKLL